jgi:hypothetical protein
MYCAPTAEWPLMSADGGVKPPLHRQTRKPTRNGGVWGTRLQKETPKERCTREVPHP